MTNIDWPNTLVTDNDQGIPTLPFRETETGAIGYGHQNPASFAGEVSNWIWYQMIQAGEQYVAEEHGKVEGDVRLIWVFEDGEWLTECEEKTPDAFPVTVIGEL